MISLTAPLPAPHGFFTRQGGVSTGPYESLNCSTSSQDNPTNVTENRRRVATAMGVKDKDLIGLKQTHSTKVITVTTPWHAGAGPDADAMVAITPNIALGIVTADCAPVLFADAKKKIIGAAHAGWRGALAGILEETVNAMKKLGAEKIQAAIGPCIHQQSYEVAADLRNAILAQNPADAKFFHPGRPSHWQFNLPAYCQSRLAAIKIPASILPHDTCAEEQNFFSHRRRTLRGEPAIGHQISVITL